MLLPPALLIALAAVIPGGARESDTVSLGHEGRVTYKTRSSPFKPYVAQLRTPAGIGALEDAPPDHLHHHGLMLALGVDGTDFWDESDPSRCGRQDPQSIELALPSLSLSETGSVRQEIHWENPEGDPLLLEERTLSADTADGATFTLLTWRSVLTLPEGRDRARLWGRHYFGLGLRFHPDAKGNGIFLNDGGREGKVVAGDERLTSAHWMAFQTTIEGKPVTVAMFDHPLNPRFPANFFTMCSPFAYVTATPNLQAQERILRPNERWDLRYGVAAWDGLRTREEIEDAYRGWLESTVDLADNVALASRGTTALASSEYGPDYAAGRAIDGRYEVRERDKWNSKAHITPHFLRIDLGQPRSIDAVVIRHEGALPLADAFLYNSSDFRVQRSERPWGPWIDLVPRVLGNTDNVTVHRFNRTTTRYVRVLLETAEQGGRDEYGRLAEVEVYASAEEKKR